MSDPKTPVTSLPTDANELKCPVCGTVVDPRKTTQALSRQGRLLLFCGSGCLRQFVAAENASR